MSRWCPGCTVAVFLAGLLTIMTHQARGTGEEHDYVGTKSCKKCHFEIWESWTKTKMANSFHVLLPDSALKTDKETGLTDEWIAQIKANKTKAHRPIEPDKDYTRDPDCLRCHTTGYGLPGGYAVPDPKDKKAQRKANDLQGVGCESCHGPGSQYVKIFEEIQDKQRQYTRQELYSAGLSPVDAQTCVRCHNKESPLVAEDYVFDYETRKAEGIHQRVELKLRKE